MIQQTQYLGPPDITVVAPPSGQLLIFQGFYKPALLIARDYVPAFLKDPAKAGVLIIPPFAALALQCYSALGLTDDIEIKRDLAVDDEFECTLTTEAGQRVRYYSAVHKVPPPRTLKAQRVNYLVTPRYVALVDHDKPNGAVAIIAEVPESEKCHPRDRFGHDVKLLRDAARRAVAHKYPQLCYEN